MNDTWRTNIRTDVYARTHALGDATSVLAFVLEIQILESGIGTLVYMKYMTRTVNKPKSGIRSRDKARANKGRRTYVAATEQTLFVVHTI